MAATLSLPRDVTEPATPRAKTAFWRFLEDTTARKVYRVLIPVLIINLAVALYMALFYAPREATMGDAQRIFYFHVPSAWVGFLAFFVVFCASVMYLWKRERKWDALATASAEIGTVFTTLVLLTGPLWAKAAWGTYWTWDARLTTTMVLWLVYIGYLKLRDTLDEGRRARVAAVVGIIGFIDVPIIYFSVTWWRTMHPTLVVNDSGGLAPEMKTTLFVALASFTLLYVLLMLVRTRLEQKRDELVRLSAEA